MGEDIHVTPMDFGKAAVTLIGVSKSFGQTSVLENINFSVDEDEIVVLHEATHGNPLAVVGRWLNSRDRRVVP